MLLGLSCFGFTKELRIDALETLWAVCHMAVCHALGHGWFLPVLLLQKRGASGN